MSYRVTLSFLTRSRLRDPILFYPNENEKNFLSAEGADITMIIVVAVVG